MFVEIQDFTSIKDGSIIEVIEDKGAEVGIVCVRSLHSFINLYFHLAILKSKLRLNSHKIETMFNKKAHLSILYYYALPTFVDSEGYTSCHVSYSMFTLTLSTTQIFFHSLVLPLPYCEQLPALQSLYYVPPLLPPPSRSSLSQ